MPAKDKPVMGGDAKPGMPGNGPPAMAAATDSGAKTWLSRQNKTGSTPQSEDAVELALKWIATHQTSEGNWSFEHRGGQCMGQCPDPGTMLPAVNAATAVALLPLVNHGSTHHSGPYVDNVIAGFDFLLARMGPSGELWEEEGRMYSHALAAMAFCEDKRIAEESPANDLPVFGADKAPIDPTLKGEDKRLALIARENAMLKAKREKRGASTVRNGSSTPPGDSVRFIVASQDPHLGGWRYTPHEGSDLSVTGWQAMAIYSAARTAITVPRRRRRI